MKNILNVLLITNSENFKKKIEDKLKEEFNPHILLLIDKNRERYKDFLNQIDIIILDYNNQCFNDLESLDIARSKNTDIPFIVLSDPLGDEKAVQLLKKGASNYLLKENLEKINEIINSELKNYDIIQNKKERYNILLENEIKLENILDIFKLEKEEIEKILDFTLEQAINITNSKFGYIYDYDSNNQEIKINRWSKNTLKECKIQNIQREIKLEETGRWADAIKYKKSIIINDLKNPKYPKGHIEITRLLASPIIIDDNIVGIIGVANKENDYTEDDAKQIEFFIDYVYKIIVKKEIEKKLKENEKYYKAIVNDIPALVCRFLPDETLTFVNNTYCEYFEMKKEELIGRFFTPLIPDEDKEYVIQQFSSLSIDKPIISYNHRVILKDGTIRWMNWVDHALFDENNNIIEYQSIGRDITEEIEKSKKLETLLLEKDILLREVHHRVKNNLQVISSLIELNKSYLKENVIEILDDIKERIRSMALTYEHIYQSDNFSEINISQYLISFIDRAIHNYNFKNNLKREINIEDVNISLDIAMPIALITNELISNIFKHAFNNIENPTLTIKLKKIEDNRFLFMIKDNGIGIPENIDPYSDNTFGFMLINLLVKQINGEMKIKKDNGTEITILFCDNLYKKRKV